MGTAEPSRTAAWMSGQVNACTVLGIEELLVPLLKGNNTYGIHYNNICIKNYFGPLFNIISLKHNNTANTQTFVKILQKFVMTDLNCLQWQQACFWRCVIRYLSMNGSFIKRTVFFLISGTIKSIQIWLFFIIYSSLFHPDYQRLDGLAIISIKTSIRFDARPACKTKAEHLVHIKHISSKTNHEINMDGHKIEWFKVWCLGDGSH